MSTFNSFQSRDYDIQDGTKRSIWGSHTYKEGSGWILKVSGNGTEDDEVVPIHGVTGFHLPDDSDAEVLLLAGSSDTAQKFALAMIPRDKQRQWGENTGGIQSPADPTRAVEVNPKRTYVDDINFALRAGIFEVKDGVVYIRARVVVEQNLEVAGSIKTPNPIHTPTLLPGAEVVVPGFEE